MSHKTNLSRNAVVILLSLAAYACGTDLRGVYSGEEEGFLDQIEFKDDDRVELMFFGTIKEATYQIEDNKVRINQGGEITILEIDDSGCLNGGGILGRYCKGGKSRTADKTGSGDGGSEDLIGHQFAVGPAGDQMVLEFLDDRRVRFGMEGDYEELSYQTRGGEIIVRGLDGNNLVLVRRGKDLEGGPDGMVMVFQRR